MKLDKYLESLHHLHNKIRIPLIALLLLHQVHDGWAKEEDVTITSIITDNPVASQATAHKYLQLLIKRKILEVYVPADGRKKLLCIGSKYADLVDYVGSVK
jgi:hypothetical protein